MTARAEDSGLAYKAGVFFFGRMLDALTLTINTPMYLSLGDAERARPGRHEVRRLIELDEIQQAFDEAHRLAINRPSFLRALGWYRKALCGDDPFDKFLAFWNALECVAAKYYSSVPTIDTERAKKGSKSQLWECFKALWNSTEEWPIIRGQHKWIDENYQTRNDIAHGVKAVDVHTVAEVVSKIITIQEVAHTFLRDWRDRFLYLNQLPEPAYLDTVDEGLFVQ